MTVRPWTKAALLAAVTAAALAGCTSHEINSDPEPAGPQLEFTSEPSYTEEDIALAHDMVAHYERTVALFDARGEENARLTSPALREYADRTAIEHTRLKDRFVGFSYMTGQWPPLEPLDDPPALPGDEELSPAEQVVETDPEADPSDAEGEGEGPEESPWPRVQRLEQLQGPEFDRFWRDSLVASHEIALEKARIMLDEAPARELRELAQRVLDRNPGEIEELRALPL
ncbi:DUF305 domain-containing protein [Actinoalloteichus caeruleus]|uniref:DUF305 domain-containing protein n=1 Tax=Actinoalloteichus cyanogriseus TaxID=2893586 RepID=UPI0009DF4B38|nr:DUF305 domain-containing protein [Actinoalloteichus caeruleus]